MADGDCLAVLWGGSRLNISYERMRWAVQHVFLHDKMRMIKHHCSGGYLECLPPLVQHPPSYMSCAVGDFAQHLGLIYKGDVVF